MEGLSNFFQCQCNYKGPCWTRQNKLHLTVLLSVQDKHIYFVGRHLYVCITLGRDSFKANVTNLSWVFLGLSTESASSWEIPHSQANWEGWSP